jgi:tetratricopeptide (TPR) repeat protein
MYAQAMKGRHEIALGYADEMIERALCSEHAVCMRQERAVILRMMGKNEEAESEFKNLLAPGEDYECLIQMSYIKHLEGDFKGALKYARRAKKLESPVRFDMPEYRFTLAVKALPTEFCHWLLYHVDESTEASASSSV